MERRPHAATRAGSARTTPGPRSGRSIWSTSASVSRPGPTSAGPEVVERELEPHCARRAAFHEPRAGFVANLVQAQSAQARRERATQLVIDAAPGEDLETKRLGSGMKRCPKLTDRDRRNVVHILDNQPAARTQSVRQLAQHGAALGQVLEDQAGVDEVVGSLLQRVAHNVVLADLDGGGFDLEVLGSEIGGDDQTLAADDRC